MGQTHPSPPPSPTPPNRYTVDIDLNGKGRLPRLDVHYVAKDAMLGPFIFQHVDLGSRRSITIARPQCDLPPEYVIVVLHKENAERVPKVTINSITLTCPEGPLYSISHPTPIAGGDAEMYTVTMKWENSISGVAGAEIGEWNS